MSTFVDFKELKATVSIEHVLDMLGVRALKRHGEQLRGPCPIHNGTGDREFVVTPAKGLFYCFAGCGGGDIIALVAKIKDCNLKDAANLIARQLGNGTVPRNGTVTGPGPATAPQNEKGQLKPLDYLQATHEAVQALGIAPETCGHFGAGFASKGLMRGRMAIPVHDKGGLLLAYCGQAISADQQPRLTFPQNFDPHSVVFNAHRLAGGELYLVTSPLQVLTAHQGGIANVVSFLTDGIKPSQWEMLSLLMDEKQCDLCYRFQ